MALIQLDAVDSTNRYLKELPDAALGTAVLAARQTAGYGQRGRTWASPPGAGMYLSVLTALPTPPTLLPLVAGLAARDAVARWTPEAGLKWVNDLVARGHKLGGVLVEASRGRAVIGIGLNLLTPDVENAIGLDALTEAPPSPLVLAEAVLAALDARLAAWAADGPDGLRADWRAACVVMGREVVVEDVRGIAQDVGPGGELLVRTSQGLKTVVSGTLRMADGSYC